MAALFGETMDIEEARTFLQTQPSLVLLPNGQWVQQQPQTLRVIGQCDSILSTVASKASYYTGEIDDGIHALITGKQIYAIKALDELVLNTWWSLAKVAGNTVMYPSWTPCPDSAKLALIWKPPKTMTLVLIVWIENFCPIEAYLVAIHSSLNTTHKLPMANLYEDGRVCMGTVDHGRRSICGSLRHFEKHINDSEWNPDIMPNGDFHQELFRFSEDGKQKRITSEWHKHCIKVSSSAYNDIIERFTKYTKGG